MTSDQRGTNASRTSYDIKRATGGWHIVRPSNITAMAAFGVIAATIAVGSFLGTMATVVTFFALCAIAFVVVTRSNSSQPVLVVDEHESELSQRFCAVVRRVTATRDISFDRRRQIRSEMASGWLALTKHPSQHALDHLDEVMSKAIEEIELEEAKIKAQDAERVERIAKRFKLKRPESSDD